MKRALLLSFAVGMAAATSHAELIEFTSPYSDGGLNGQQNWNAEAGWTVADSAGAGNVATLGVNEIATFNKAITLSTGESYSYNINFEFTGAFTPLGVSQFTYAFQTGLSADPSATSVGIASPPADVNIQIFGNGDDGGGQPVNGGDDYRLLSGFATLAGAGNITSGFNAGDILSIDYTLTLGATAAASSYTAKLDNVTDGLTTNTGTVTGIDPTVFTALTGTGAYQFFQVNSPGNNASGLTGVQVNSVTVIPEPSTVALTLLGVGALAFLRKRRA